MFVKSFVSKVGPLQLLNRGKVHTHLASIRIVLQKGEIVQWSKMYGTKMHGKWNQIVNKRYQY